MSRFVLTEATPFVLEQDITAGVRGHAQFKDADGEFGAPAFHVLVVTDERLQAALLSLVAPNGQLAPSWHFTDMDTAIAHGAQRCKEWLEFS